MLPSNKCAVGRDALILPRRNLADCNKRCKPFVGDDAWAIPHNSKCRYGERGAADAKPKAQIILDAAKVSAASGGCSEPKQGQRSQSARGFCPRSTMRVPQPDIIEHFGNADAVPQLPERCLSRKAGIVRCCPCIVPHVGPCLIPPHLKLHRPLKFPSSQKAYARAFRARHMLFLLSHYKLIPPAPSDNNTPPTNPRRPHSFSCPGSGHTRAENRYTPCCLPL